jgi:hypothetical protein
VAKRPTGTKKTKRGPQKRRAGKPRAKSTSSRSSQAAKGPKAKFDRPKRLTRRQLLNLKLKIIKRQAPGERGDLYAQAARKAVRNGETNKLIRHILSAGLADDSANDQLPNDLVLIRWVLGKMEANRRDAELKSAAHGLVRRRLDSEGEHDDYGGIQDEEF